MTDLHSANYLFGVHYACMWTTVAAWVLPITTGVSCVVLAFTFLLCIRDLVWLGVLVAIPFALALYVTCALLWIVLDSLTITNVQLLHARTVIREGAQKLMVPLVNALPTGFADVSPNVLLFVSAYMAAQVCWLLYAWTHNGQHVWAATKGTAYKVALTCLSAAVAAALVLLTAAVITDMPVGREVIQEVWTQMIAAVPFDAWHFLK